MKFNDKRYAGLALLALAGCGTIDGLDDTVRSPSAKGNSVTASGISDFPQKIGEPYQVDGTTYIPQDVAAYDEVGYASWYGDELSGNPTANGERFNPDAISGAHKTLPLPSYVEVTALDTGRTILVRINDRGPFANDRLIDLSRGAARQLGIEGNGFSGVRVRKVNPNEQERAVLRGGGVATDRIATPDSLLLILRKNLAALPRPSGAGTASAPSYAPSAITPGAVTPSPATGARDGRFIVESAAPAVPVRAATPAKPIPAPVVNTEAEIVQSSVGDNYVGGLPGSYVVQVAAFGDKSRADALARKLGATAMPNASRSVWRVRYGPYATEEEANTALEKARSQGYAGASIMLADR
jgi:rare lipoprotein A